MGSWKEKTSWLSTNAILSFQESEIHILKNVKSSNTAKTKSLQTPEKYHINNFIDSMN